MEVRKEEWKVDYGEGNIVGAGHKTWEWKRVKRERLSYLQ
jgi:hypothetical protein